MRLIVSEGPNNDPTLLLWRTFSLTSNLRHFRHALSHYSYSRETPDRFRKDIVKSIESEEGVVKKDSLNQILINIGRKDQILSDDEFGVLCKEAGTKRTLPASEAMKLLETTN